MTDPTPEHHKAAARKALSLVQLAERGDGEAFALALADMVSDPETAGALVYGMTSWVRTALSMPAVPAGPARLAVLDGIAADMAAEAGRGDGTPGDPAAGP